MADPLRSLRTRAGFNGDVARLTVGAQEELFGVALGFIVEAIEADRLFLLDNWQLSLHAGCYALGLAEGEYATFTIESGVVTWERAGGPDVLSAPRRE